MAVRSIRLFPDSCLSTPCKPWNNSRIELQTLLNDLIDTMVHSPGVGLAAPQIGVSRRVSVIDVSRVKRRGEPTPNHGLILLINPRLLQGDGTQTPREGCLSVPDLLADVCRYARVSVETQTVEGEHRIIEASGFEALALQHEIDHLDGKLFLDRVSDLKTDVFRRKSYAK